MVQYDKNDWICHIAVPSYIEQTYIIAAGTCLNSVYRSALQRGYKNPVVFSKFFSHFKKPVKEDKETKIETKCKKAISIPSHLIENTEEFFD